MFSQIQMNVIKFCARECKHQQSGEMSVAHMCEAYHWAENLFYHTGLTEVSIELILELGKLVEPDKNIKGFRTQSVMIRPSGLIISAENIEYKLNRLIDMQEELTPDQFYREFEEIHPFIDGNGRVGAILYNYLRKTMNEPEFPPNFWSN